MSIIDRKTKMHQMTEGKELPLILAFAVPMFIGNIFQQFYNLVDSAIVGRFVGKEALAAVGASGGMHWLFFSLCSGLGTGIGILVAHYYGANELNRIKSCITNAFYLVGFMGLLMSSLAVIFSRELLVLLNTPADILDEATRYMQIYNSGILFVGIYNMLSCVLRALGDSVTPLYFLIFSCVLNVALDVLFVVVFQWGSAGAAGATVVAQFAAAVLCLIYAVRKNEYFRFGRGDWGYSHEIIGRSCRIGIPMALQTSMIALSMIILQSVVNSYGTVVIAAFTASSRLDNLVSQPFASVGSALSTFCGQNMGAGKKNRIRTAIRQCTALVFGFYLVVLVIIQTCAPYIMQLFTDEAEVISFGSSALRITSVCYIFLGLIYVTRGTLNGVGDTGYSFIVGLFELACRIVIPRLVCPIPEIGVWGIWITCGGTWFVVAVFSIIRFWSGSWRKKSLIN